jgi:hypothetical protein
MRLNCCTHGRPHSDHSKGKKRISHSTLFFLTCRSTDTRPHIISVGETHTGHVSGTTRGLGAGRRREYQ